MSGLTPRCPYVQRVLARVFQAVQDLAVGELPWWEETDAIARELLPRMRQSHKVDRLPLGAILGGCKVWQLPQRLLCAARVGLGSQAFGGPHLLRGVRSPCCLKT